MHTLTFSTNPTPTTALLLPKYAVNVGNKGVLGQHYGMPIGKYAGRKVADELVAIGLYHPAQGNLKAVDMKAFAGTLLEYLDTNGIDNVIIADSKYFQYLAGVKGIEKYIGSKLDCALPGYEHICVIPTVSYAVLDRNPGKARLLDLGNRTVASLLAGDYQEAQFFEFADGDYRVASTPEALSDELAMMMVEPIIAVDIETTGLSYIEDEMLTIAFAPSNHEAVAAPIHEHYGVDVAGMNEVLKEFFTEYEGKIVLHNAPFDIKFLVKGLFMADLDDYDGMLAGINTMRHHDTRIIAYLCLNSTERSPLGLKQLAMEYLGDYAEDVKEAIKVPLDDLLHYNGKDVAGTYWLYEKYWPMMLEEEQLGTYTSMFEPSQYSLLKAMMTGLPVDQEVVAAAKERLTVTLDEANKTIHGNPYVGQAVDIIKDNTVTRRNAAYKVKRITRDDVEHEFNANSGNQLRILLFDVLGFEPIEFTDGGAEKTNRASIAEFLGIAKAERDDETVAVLEALITVSETEIVRNTFINALETMSVQNPSGQYWIHGDLVLGGTQSGRLSSRNPNLQNLPSNSTHGKTIKACIVPPEGWLFGAADYSALDSSGVLGSNA